MTAEQRKLVREAMFVLGIPVVSGAAARVNNAMANDLVEPLRSDPEAHALLGSMPSHLTSPYTDAIAELLRVLGAGSVTPAPTPPPLAPAPDISPTPAPVPAPAPAPSEDGVTWIKSPAGGGAGIYFESDTDFSQSQRPAGTRHRQIAGIVLSEDGGIGLHQNVIWPEDGGRAYIPDPTRYGVSRRFDRMGMESVNLYEPGAEFAPGKHAIKATHKGQLAVWIPETNGDLTLRLPQGGRLLVEKGAGQTLPDGHKMTVSRQEVLLGNEVGSPAGGSFDVQAAVPEARAVTYIPHIATQSVTLGNELPDGSFSKVMTLALGGNNDKSQRNARLKLKWEGDYSAEIEVEPGPDAKAGNGNSIVSQVMLWGSRTEDGTKRHRITLTVAGDDEGGEYGIVDSTTNDPTVSAGQQHSMPLVFNAGEGKGMYLILYPSDNTVSIQDRGSGKGVERMPLTEIIAALIRAGL